MTRRVVRIAATMLLVFAAVGCSKHVDNREYADPLKAVVGSTPRWVDRTATGKRLWSIERTFYEQQNYRPVWIDGDRTTRQVKDLIQQLQYSDRHGLDPARYPIAEYERLRDESHTRFGTRFPVERVPELDARLTYGYLQYAADLLGWTSSPADLSPNWLPSPKKDDLALRLSGALSGNNIRESLEALAPTHPQYKGLQAALMRERANPGGNVERIRMNLERWRWMPRDLGDRYILVNIPAYMLQVMEGHQPVLAMRVIVGKPDTSTPLFSDEMTYIVFSPYWNIPEKILREETLPRVVNDPDFLQRNNMEVVGTSGTVDPDTIDWSDEEQTAHLRFRQKPGPENALGLVKFIFPNHFNVYLHDTPGDRLFLKPARAFSHGCIRVENPVGLAEYLLRDQSQWTTDHISDAMHAGREQSVVLKEKLPVHIGYWTAWVQPDGTVTYLDDPYHLDRIQQDVQKSHL